MNVEEKEIGVGKGNAKKSPRKESEWSKEILMHDYSIDTLVRKQKPQYIFEN